MIWSERAVRVRAPATSANLGPGFDALGLALALHDDVEARITGQGVSVAVSGEGTETAAQGERHLVVRAMRMAFGAMGDQPPGIALACLNVIPHGCGLGSSAAAICTGLHAARALVPGGLARLPDEQLFRLAADMEGHPDNVAACLAGGLVIAWRPVAGGGVAGGARLLRLATAGTLSAVVCVPPFPLATQQARQVLPAAVPHAEAAANAARAALLVAALTGGARAGEAEVLFAATEDFLHQAYRAHVMPETAELLGRLREAGLAAVVSGAGPSVLVLTVPGEPPGLEIPEVVDSIARETGITWRVIPLDIDRQGVTVQPVGMDAHQSGSARQGRPWNQPPGPGVRRVGGPPQDQPAPPRHMDHRQGNAVGSCGVKLGAALGAPLLGQVLARHLPTFRLHGRLWPVFPRRFLTSPLPLGPHRQRNWHGDGGRRAGRGVWACPGSRGFAADAGLGKCPPAVRQAGATTVASAQRWPGQTPGRDTGTPARSGRHPRSGKDPS